MKLGKHSKKKKKEYAQFDESGEEYAAGKLARVLSRTVPPKDAKAETEKDADELEQTDSSDRAETGSSADSASTEAAEQSDAAEPGETHVMDAVDEVDPAFAPAHATAVLPASAVAERADSQLPESAWADAPKAEPKKKRSTGKVVGITLLVIALVLGAVYGAGAFFFSSHAYPNTTLGTEDVSMKSNQQIADIVESIVSNYTVTTTGAGTHFAFSMKDAGVDVNGEAVAEKALGMYSPWRWPLELTEHHDVTDSMTNSANAGGLEQLVTDTVNKYNETGTDPVNASIVYDSDARTYVIEPEKSGTKLDPAKVLEAVDTAVATMSATATLSEDDYIKAAVTQEDPQLRAAAETASNYVRANIDLVLGSDATPAGNINGDQISQWVILTDGVNVGFNEEEMDRWLKEYADGLDTIGSERTYTRPDGAVFTVSGGTYGWEVDSQALVDQVREAILGGQQLTITVPTFSEGYIYPAEKGQPEWGKYIDVSIGEQYARCYDTEGNLIWESAIVSGSPDGKHDTPYGVYSLLNKQAPAVLKGEIQEATGQPEYETQVAYWMPFTYQGHGFHDATWQPDFGGSRYADGWGSHGCVNLPYGKAEELYSLIDIGNAVVIHG